jgi:hypothetical protein
VNAASPDDITNKLPTVTQSEAAMKADVRTIRLRSSTARAARVARSEADRIEGLRQAAIERKS